MVGWDLDRGISGSVTSLAWQREIAESMIAGGGVITAEFFDFGCTRRVSWMRRPHAAALLEQTTVVGRSFDAVVVGEFERAFTEGQLQQVVGLLRPHGVTVWARGCAWPASDVGGDDRADRRAGPVSGGRPPYGYRLVDAGPHPNRAHAAWGRRRQRLDLDPVTARHVRWMFTERLAGRSMAGSPVR
jgi:site-specific DNA recombinase